MTSNKKTWDWTVRLCHWLIVILITLSWWTAENHQMENHRYVAYSLVGVLVFRVYWGFWGASHALFKNFLTTPKTALNYFKKLGHRNAPITQGHNPLGGYSAVMMWLLIAIQIILGLFAIDVDGFDGGPFIDAISFETARQFAHWHELNFNILTGFIFLHLAAISYYLIWRKQNLVKPMITGNSISQSAEFETQKVSKLHLIIGLALAIASSTVLWIFG